MRSGDRTAERKGYRSHETHSTGERESRRRPSGRGSFASAWYWSSSENNDGNGYAWIQDFSDGYQGNFAKYNGSHVRAVRAFTNLSI